MSKKQDEEEATAKRLQEPFAPAELDWTAAKTDEKVKRVQAFPAVKPLAVLERLNDVCGVGGWMEAHTLLPTGEVECALSILVGDHWIRRAGVSSPPKTGENGKPVYRPLYQESLCGAAFKFGVGIYLTRLPKILADYNPETKCLIGTPKLPLWAIPEQWQETGPEHGAALWKLVEQCAKNASKQPVDVLRPLLERHGYPAADATVISANWLASLPRCHSRNMQTEVHGWLQAQAKKSSDKTTSA